MSEENNIPFGSIGVMPRLSLFVEFNFYILGLDFTCPDNGEQWS